MIFDNFIRTSIKNRDINKERLSKNKLKHLDCKFNLYDNEKTNGFVILYDFLFVSLWNNKLFLLLILSKYIIMCTKVDCENVVISFFNKSHQKEITFRDLNIIRKEIEKLEESVFVDVSYSAIRKTAIKFQDYIEIEENKIHLVREGFPTIKDVNLKPSYIEVIENRIKGIKANSQE